MGSNLKPIKRTGQTLVVCAVLSGHVNVLLMLR